MEIVPKIETKHRCLTLPTCLVEWNEISSFFLTNCQIFDFNKAIQSCRTTNNLSSMINGRFFVLCPTGHWSIPIFDVIKTIYKIFSKTFFVGNLFKWSNNKSNVSLLEWLVVFFPDISLSLSLSLRLVPK